MIKVNLEAPWYTYAKKVKALFALDSDIEVGEVVELDGGDIQYGLDINVKNHDKFVALDRVLPDVVEFGNVKLGIILEDEENIDTNSDIELYKTIFDGNRIVKDIKETIDSTGTRHAYVRFYPEVIQFFDDNLADYNGNWSGLAQDIANEVFDNEYRGVHFCTADIRENSNEKV